MEIQAGMLASATSARDDRTVEAASIGEAVEAAQVGWARLAWDLLRDGGEARLAEDAVTVRCLQRADGGLPRSEDESDLVATVGRSYLQDSAGRAPEIRRFLVASRSLVRSF